MTWGRFLLVFYLFGSTLTQKTEKIEKRLKRFKCTFTLTFSDRTVDLNSSSVSCIPKKRSKKNVKVVLETKDKEYIFNAKININPTSIQDIEVIPPERPLCGGYDGRMVNGLNDLNTRGYTCKNMELWENGEVSWAFVSNGDNFKKFGFYMDENIGLSESDAKLTMEAMEIIKEKTGCIKFMRTENPDKSKPWLLVMRESKCNQQCICQKAYIKENLNDKQIGNLGTPFKGYWNGKCFRGAFVDGLGIGTPRKLVFSSVRRGSVGLLVHEILHALGVGHTQKRLDRDKYITIKWDNIVFEQHSQYDPCNKSWTCNECENHGTEYNCNSIMHYWDGAFAIDNKQSTMIAKDPKTCDVTNFNDKLQDSDVTLLKKMYCQSSTSGQIMSPNFPNNYTINGTKQFPLKVEDGFKIQLTFTDFDIEEEAACSWDYVEVLDSDNTQMIKECGNSIPGAITSKGNTMTVNFYSDYSETRKGFKAIWKKVGATESGVIQSPNYPNLYSIDLNETYDIAVADGSKIELTFNDFNIEPNEGCTYDWVEVINTDGERIGQRMCGLTIPQAMHSNGNTMKVNFHSDESENFKGFSATWKKVTG